MPEEKERKHNYEVNIVIDRILDQIPQIVPGRIELFSEVYYPIALLEMEMTETTFEDFDLLPLSVLKFIGSEVTESQEIADLMGLSRNYVQKIIDLLMGYGYVNENGLSELGKEALRIEKKVAHSAVRQRFQADAITGDLLKIGEQPSDADLQDGLNTFGVIPHIPHIEGISLDEINEQLRDEDLTKYKHYQGEILNANVDEIRNCICVDLEYVKAYLVKLQGIDSPFIITYRYDASKTEFKERFRWLPMRLPTEKAYIEYGFSRDIQLYSEESLKTINALYSLVCKTITEIDEKRLKKLLGHIHPFDYSNMDISMGRITSGIPEQISIYLNADSFTKWNPFVLSFLSEFDDVGGYLYTNSWLNGLFIRFESQNLEIRKTAKEYQKILRHYKKSQVNMYVRKKLFTEEANKIRLLDLMDILKEFILEYEDN